jgi:tetratricopeptide (TPR) repeat protein/uncharacterized membrane protein
MADVVLRLTRCNMTDPLTSACLTINDNIANGRFACSRGGIQMRWLAALLLLIGSGSQAFAGIKFCNNFEHPVRFAVAFQTPESWVSDGWLTVAPKACAIDTKHADLTEFYWSGETDWVNVGGGKRSKWSWGKNRQLSVKDESFTLKNADQKLRGARFAGFAGPVKFNVPSIVVTVTIEDEKNTTTVIPSEADALTSDPDYQTCENSSGDEAIAACDRGIGSGKFSGSLLAGLHVNRGVERGNKNDPEGALSDYDEAIRIDAKNALAYVNRGSSRLDKDEYDAALQDFGQAILLNPNLLSAYRGRANTYREKGDLDHAVDDYKKALSLNPNDDQKTKIETALSNAYVDRGVDQKDQNAELADYDEAIRNNPNNVTALNNRGATYIEKGEYDRAIQDLDQAIELKADYSRAFRNRGDAYRKKGDRDHAIADYQKALSFNPDEALRKKIQAALDDLGAGAGAGATSPSGSSTGKQ